MAIKSEVSALTGSSVFPIRSASILIIGNRLKKLYVNLTDIHRTLNHISICSSNRPFVTGACKIFWYLRPLIRILVTRLAGRHHRAGFRWPIKDPWTTSGSGFLVVGWPECRSHASTQPGTTLHAMVQVNTSVFQNSQAFVFMKVSNSPGASVSLECRINPLPSANPGTLSQLWAKTTY